MEEEKKIEEEIIEGKIDREEDMETRKEEEEGEEEEDVMIIGMVVIDKIDDLAKKMIKIKMITQIKIKNLINKMNTLILIKI